MNNVRIWSFHTYPRTIHKSTGFFEHAPRVLALKCFAVIRCRTWSNVSRSFSNITYVLVLCTAWCLLSLMSKAVKCWQRDCAVRLHTRVEDLWWAQRYPNTIMVCIRFWSWTSDSYFKSMSRSDWCKIEWSKQNTMQGKPLTNFPGVWDPKKHEWPEERADNFGRVFY